MLSFRKLYEKLISTGLDDSYIDMEYLDDERVDDELLDHDVLCNGYRVKYKYISRNRRGRGVFIKCCNCIWISEKKMTLFNVLNSRENCLVFGWLRENCENGNNINVGGIGVKNLIFKFYGENSQKDSVND